MYILNYLVEVLLLILNYVWNTSFNLRHNSRLGVLQDWEFDCFPDKENLVQRLGEIVLLGWHRAQTSPSSNTGLISAVITGLGNAALMRGTCRATPSYGLGQGLLKNYWVIKACAGLTENFHHAVRKLAFSQLAHSLFGLGLRTRR